MAHVVSNIFNLEAKDLVHGYEPGVVFREFGDYHALRIHSSSNQSDSSPIRIRSWSTTNQAHNSDIIQKTQGKQSKDNHLQSTTSSLFRIVEVPPFPDFILFTSLKMDHNRISFQNP